MCVHKRGFEFNTSGKRNPICMTPRPRTRLQYCCKRWWQRPPPLPPPPPTPQARWLRLNPSVSVEIRLLHLRAAAAVSVSSAALFALYLQGGERRQQEGVWEKKRVMKKGNTETWLEALARENRKDANY